MKNPFGEGLRRNCERGFVTVLLAMGLLIVLLVIAGLALDVSHAQKVQGELHNDGDAAALAGAGLLYPSASYPAPNWALAASTATTFIASNKSDGKPLKDGTVQVGYWNLVTKTWTGTPVTANNDGTLSTTPTGTPSGQDIPAVMVTVSRSDGNNGGAVPTYFARIAGWTGFQVSHKPALAVSGAPGSYGPSSDPGRLFPFAITNNDPCMKNGVLKGGGGPSNPVTFYSVYNSDAHTADWSSTVCAGQWTSLIYCNGNANDSDTTIKDLINVGNDPSKMKGNSFNVCSGGANSISLGTDLNIWVDAGTKASLYNEANNVAGTCVMVPVVANVSDSTHSSQPLVSWVPFHITSTFTNGNHSSITGYWAQDDPSCKNAAFTIGTGGGDPSMGAYTMPQLLQ